VTPGCPKVEAIGRNSNLGHLCKKWTELRKRINESPGRPPLSQPNDPKPRGKRFLTADAVTDIVRRYEGGETTQHVGKRYGISKTRVASILTYHGVPTRRQGLNEEQVNEAARLYIAGKSLAWIGAVYGVSHTTVAAALRRKDVELRPRPGWV
jgi:DNA invertase Pin-like site-specific DNA recombinase